MCFWLLGRLSWRATWPQAPPCSTAGTTGWPDSGRWSARRRSPAAWKTAPCSCSSVWTSTWWWRPRRSPTSRCQRNTSIPSHTSLFCGYSLKPPCRIPHVFLLFCCSQMFLFWVSQFLFLLFGIFIYDTRISILHTFEYIDIYLFVFCRNEKKEFGCLGYLPVCTCSVCLCVRVCEREILCLQTLLSFWDVGAKQNENVCGFWCPRWDFHVTDRQTTETCDCWTLILMLDSDFDVGRLWRSRPWHYRVFRFLWTSTDQEVNGFLSSRKPNLMHLTRNETYHFAKINQPKKGWNMWYHPAQIGASSRHHSSGHLQSCGQTLFVTVEMSNSSVS